MTSRPNEQSIQTPTAYKPLSGDEIRLLCIHPGLPDDPLVCSLTYHNLSTTGASHTAISYPWGPPEDQHHVVLVNDIEFSVRENAFSILSRIRSRTESVKVWIDCLCINQEDKPEKGAQIKLMYSIYRQASRTIIWLGKTVDQNKEIIDFIHSLDIDSIYEEFKRGWEARWIYPKKSFILAILESNPRKQQLVNGSACLFSAAYWTRVWIRQEAAVGGNPQLLWGEHKLNWKHVAVLAWIFLPRTSADWDEQNWMDFDYVAMEFATQTVMAIESFRFRTAPVLVRGVDAAATTLFSQMVYSRSGLTEKPHDRVYALSSMASDLNQKDNNLPTFLEPNYELSWQEVYVNAARFFFSSPYSAWMVLEHAGMVFQGAGSDLPSWVPDWRYPVLPFFIALEDWCAGGSRGHVKTHVVTLSKKQRSQILSYQSYASIKLLCGPVPRDICKISMTDEYQNLGKKQTLTRDFVCLNSSCKDKISKAECSYRESAYRAALALEIQVGMQDEIVYLARSTLWDVDAELDDFAKELASIDTENLAFLESQSVKRVDGLYITSELLREAYNWTLVASQNSESAPATQNLIETADVWRDWLVNDRISHVDDLPPFQKAIATAFTFRGLRFAYTKHGYMCLVPKFTQLGDQITIVAGYQVPLVLRPTVAHYRILIGPCYVHGMMKGIMGSLIDEFQPLYDVKLGKTILKRPQGDIRANGLKMEAGRYIDILETLGNRWVTLI